MVDRIVGLCRQAGFRKVLLRGDTDFSQSEHLDRWHAEGTLFVFGFDAMPAESEGALPKICRRMPGNR